MALSDLAREVATRPWDHAPLLDLMRWPGTGSVLHRTSQLLGFRHAEDEAFLMHVDRTICGFLGAMLFGAGSVRTIGLRAPSSPGTPALRQWAKGQHLPTLRNVSQLMLLLPPGAERCALLGLTDQVESPRYVPLRTADTLSLVLQASQQRLPFFLRFRSLWGHSGSLLDPAILEQFAELGDIRWSLHRILPFSRHAVPAQHGPFTGNQRL